MKTVVVVSGGMDSVTTLWWASHKYGHDSIKALTFDYGSKHSHKEIECAKINCSLLNIEHHILNLDFSLFKSNLLKGGEDIPQGHYAQDNMKLTVVPNRNMILLSYAIALAESTDSKQVIIGSHQGDRAIYPDCRVEFTAALNLASMLGTYNQIRVVSPFNDLTKAQIGKIGLDLGVDYSLTWSCYEGKDRPCLKCGTCVERTEVFVENDIPDPLLTEEEWLDAVEFYEDAKQKFEDSLKEK